jgi:hypothetical protein
MKRRKNAFLLCGLLFLVGLLAVLARPRTLQATSADGYLVARVTSPSLLSLLVKRETADWEQNMRVRIWVIDVKAGETIKVRDSMSNGVLGGDGEWPEEVSWSSDDKELIYECQVETAMKRTTFSVQRQPLRIKSKSSSFN